LYVAISSLIVSLQFDPSGYCYETAPTVSEALPLSFATRKKTRENLIAQEKAIAAIENSLPSGDNDTPDVRVHTPGAERRSVPSEQPLFPLPFLRGLSISTSTYPREMPLWSAVRRSPLATRFLGPVPDTAHYVPLRQVPGHVLFGESCIAKGRPQNFVIEWVIQPVVVEHIAPFPTNDDTIDVHVNYLKWYAARGRAILDHLALQESQGLHTLRRDHPAEFPPWRRTVALALALLEQHVDHLQEASKGTHLDGSTLRAHMFWMDMRWPEIHPTTQAAGDDIARVIRRIALPHFVWDIDFSRRNRLVRYIQVTLDNTENALRLDFGPAEGSRRYVHFVHRALSFAEEDIRIFLKARDAKLSVGNGPAVDIAIRRSTDRPLSVEPGPIIDNPDKMAVNSTNPFDAVYQTLHWALDEEQPSLFNDSSINEVLPGDADGASFQPTASGDAIPPLATSTPLPDEEAARPSATPVATGHTLREAASPHGNPNRDGLESTQRQTDV
jgi:hypothetical protein